MRISLLKDKLNAIFCFEATAAMNVYDLNEPVKNSCALVAFGSFKVPGNSFPVGWMARVLSLFQLADRLRIAEFQFRKLGVSPSNDEPLFRRAKPSPQDVIESIQVPIPTILCKDNAAKVVREFFQ